MDFWLFSTFSEPLIKCEFQKVIQKKTEFSTISYKKNYKTQFLMISYKKRNLKTGILYMVSGGLGVYHIMVVYVVGYLISVE